MECGQNNENGACCRLTLWWRANTNNLWLNSESKCMAVSEVKIENRVAGKVIWDDEGLTVVCGEASGNT